MKLSSGRIDAFLAAPDADVRAVLLYGPDAGLVRERARALTATVAGDAADPFRVVELAAAGLRGDPARLADEAAAIAFTGGRRVVRVAEAGDPLAGLLESFLEEAPGDALVVVEAGELGPRSALRRLFEGAANAAALPCYADEGRDLEAVIDATLGQRGITVAPDARAYLLENLGADRMVTRGELEKLALYAGDGGRVELADAEACIIDSAGFALDSVAYAAADGDAPALERALSRAFEEGVQPITMLRAVARHFQRLHLAAGLVTAGMAPEQALKSLRPPVFFKLQARFRAQLRKWPPVRLSQALEILTEAELDCKNSALPADVVCGRALLRLTQAARAA